MHISTTTWMLAACLGTVINASDVLEVNLVFPRNETYAPNDTFPVVFAFKNSELARHLNPSISYSLWNEVDNSADILWHELSWVNWTAQETYFAYRYSGTFSTEGRWRVLWTLGWNRCNVESPEYGNGVISTSNTSSTVFTTSNSAPKLDPVAATANKTCTGQPGVAINVTDKTKSVSSALWEGGKYTNHTCAVVAASPTPSTNPCRTQIDETALASMEASSWASYCDSNFNEPAECSDKKSSAQPLAVAGLSCLLGLTGALGFFLV
ncbi:uncharacterized protein N7515_001057 [Penicillium bovifimosum]|uniref:DUF7136 domain-containing protein n=1 Tax=Penicillium bovifimosum TaxID=126998 RepID=A0A9W9HGU7_9EURO|nr:uncharacterized protein N7515_001057 [Penicillium bovifimosum]KAJ5146493.1 hypothetical protein N7515_001057 [Penicillium bovifimosum]